MAKIEPDSNQAAVEPPVGTFGPRRGEFAVSRPEVRAVWKLESDFNSPVSFPEGLCKSTVAVPTLQSAGRGLTALTSLFHLHSTRYTALPCHVWW